MEVSNTWNKAKADEPVVIKLSEINPQFRVRSAVVMNGSEEIPSQLDDLNGDLRPDELAFVIDLPAKSKKNSDRHPVFRQKATRLILPVYMPRCW